MPSDQVDEAVLRQYLLGGLTEEAGQALEERLLSDDRLFEILSVVEDELADDYVWGRLGDRDRRNFESYFLSSPNHRRKLEFAQSFRHYLKYCRQLQTVPAASAPRPDFGVHSRPLAPLPAWGWALAALLVLSALLSVWLLQQNRALQHETNLLRNALSVELTAGLRRGAGRQAQINIPGGANLIDFYLPISPKTVDDRLRAALYDVDARELMRLDRLEVVQQPGRTAAIFPVPALVLKPGDYYVEILRMADSGVQVIDSYAFRVTAP